eukprot:12582005-Prorocentrum_lima.AAC.1
MASCSAGILAKSDFAPGEAFPCRFGVSRHTSYETPRAAAFMDCCWLVLGLCFPADEHGGGH